MSAPPPATAPRSVLSRELLPASIAIFATAALVSLQVMGIAAATPEIAADLGDVSLLPWAITAYLLTSGMATVVAGPFVDSVGVRKVFRVAVVIFAAAGFAAAYSPTMGALIAIRAVQGIGAGLILTSGNAAISLIYPDHLVARAFAANATVWGVMGVAGPAVAAWILTFLSWQWIFYLNLPFGLLALAVGWRAMPGPYGSREGRTDVRGPVLLGIVVLALLFAVDALDVISLAWTAAAGAALAGYVWHARRVAAPVVRLEHIARQPYLGLAASTGLLLTGTFAMNNYIPLYVRAAKDASPGMTAWSVLPLTVGWTVGAVISSRMADRHSESWIVLLGFVVNIPSLAATWFLVQADVPILGLFITFFTAGVGVGMSTNAALTLLRSVTANAQIGRASSAHLFGRNMGFTFGAAIGGAVLLFVVAGQIGDPELVRGLLAGDAATSPAGSAGAVADGFAASVAVGLVLSVLGFLSSIRLRQALASVRAAKRGGAAEVR